MGKPNDLQDRDFQKSSFCNFDPVCVEVARKNGIVAVRSSRNKNQSPIIFDEAEWRAFIAGVKNGEFEF